MAITAVIRELVVRYLEVWTPTALRTARRGTFVLAGPPVDAEMAEAALRVFADFADRLRGRRLTMLVIAPRPAEISRRLDALQAEPRTPIELGAYVIAGDRLPPAALSAAGAAGSPLLTMTFSPELTADLKCEPVSGADREAVRGVDRGDADQPDSVRTVATAGRPAEMMTVGPVGSWPAHRETARSSGFRLTASVELVAGADAVAFTFATSSLKSLEAFKNAMWSVDEFAGVGYRDPGDPAGHVLDISLRPHPGPLGRELLRHLESSGGRTVTELRRFTLTDTVYRTADTSAVLGSLLAAGAVTRSPEHGRLSGDVVIAVPRTSPWSCQD